MFRLSREVRIVDLAILYKRSHCSLLRASLRARYSIFMQRGNGPPKLVAWVDAHHNVRGTYGFIIFFAGFPILWGSRKAQHTTLSATESEVCACVEPVRYMLYIRRILEDAGLPQAEPSVVKEDNEGVIKLLKQQDLTSPRMRHVDIRLNWLKDQVAAGHVRFEWTSTDEQLADTMTKAQARHLFTTLVSKYMCD